MRVISRLGAIEADPARAGTRRAVEALVLKLMPGKDASAFNQALMDLGAMICTPRHPACGGCPAAPGCLARLRGIVDRIPPAKAALQPVSVEMTAIVVRRAGACLLVRRGEGRLMSGLWEFPLAHATAGSTVEEFARSLGAKVAGRMGRVRHSITRHRINITVYEGRPLGGRRAVAGAARPAPRLSEPGARLATPMGGIGEMGDTGELKTRWVPLRQLTGGGDGLALAGSARKIARLMSGPALLPRRQPGEAAR
jgi:A/G-specific adenine glycosylase